VDRDAERARWIGRYRASGLSVKRFAQRHGLSPGQLHYWVYQSPKREKSSTSAPMFQEVRLSVPTIATSACSAEVGLPDGTTVRLARGADVEWTQALVECLRRPCSSH
jgi:transposase-like protein